MVFMDIPDYDKAVANCIRALKGDGDFIFSISHPCFEEPDSEWEKKGYIATRDYFKEYSTKQTYGHLFHRPLSKYINLLARNSCKIKEVVEPQLDEEIAESYPDAKRNYYVPSFIVISAIKLQTTD
jgi:hypothetical protein